MAGRKAAAAAATGAADGLGADLGRASKPVRKAVSRVLKVSRGKPLRSAVLSRLVDDLASQIEGMSQKALGEAASASDEFELLMGIVERRMVDETLKKRHPLAQAKLRGLRAKRELLNSEGGLLSAEQMAEALGLSRQAVDKRRKTGKLLAFTLGRRGYSYPAWQIDKKGSLSGLEEVLDALQAQGIDNWMIAAFILNGNHRLGGKSPLQMLRKGKKEQVLRAAYAYGEQGAA